MINAAQMNNTHPLADLVNVGRYPLGSSHMTEVIARCRHQLQAIDAVALPEFLTANCCSKIADYCATRKSDSHRMDAMLTPYSDNLADVDEDKLSLEHPARMRLPASHRCLAGDFFNRVHPLHRLHRDKDFIALLQDALGHSYIYPLNDPLGGVNILMYEPGDQMAGTLTAWNLLFQSCFSPRRRVAFTNTFLLCVRIRMKTTLASVK